MLSLHDFESKFCANAAVLSASRHDFAAKQRKFTAELERARKFYAASLSFCQIGRISSAQKPQAVKLS